MIRKLGVIAMTIIILLSGCDKVQEKRIESLGDLNGKTIGVELKTTGEIYASNIEGAKVQSYNQSKDAVIALIKKNVDAVMIDAGPANTYLKEYEDICILKNDAQEEEEYAIAVKKGNVELKNKINKALDTIRENGTLNEIISGWIYEGKKEAVYQAKKGSHKNGKLLVVTEANFPPYEYINGDEIVGIDIDIMNAICDELDMELEIKSIAFDGIISSIDRGYADVGIAGISITDERKEQIDFSNPYTKAKQIILVRK